MAEPISPSTLAQVDVSHVVTTSHDATTLLWPTDAPLTQCQRMDWPKPQSSGLSVVSTHSPEVSTRRRLWACPFYKQDSWNNYRCIEKHKLRRIGDVKQHIFRSHGHNLPLNRSRSDDDEQKWYRLWDILFQGHQQPPSPYVEDGIAEPLALFRSRAQPLLEANLPLLLQAVNIQADTNTVSILGNRIQQLLFEDSHVPPQSYPSDAATSPGVPGHFGAGSDKTPLLAGCQISVNTVHNTVSATVTPQTNDAIPINLASTVLPSHHPRIQELSTASGFHDVMNQTDILFMETSLFSNSHTIHGNGEGGQAASWSSWCDLDQSQSMHQA